MEKRKSKEVSMYEPIGKDKEGNEISLIDIVGEEKEDVVEDCLFAQRVLCLYQNLDKVLKMCIRDSRCGGILIPIWKATGKNVFNFQCNHVDKGVSYRWAFCR